MREEWATNLPCSVIKDADRIFYFNLKEISPLVTNGILDDEKIAKDVLEEICSQ